MKLLTIILALLAIGLGANVPAHAASAERPEVRIVQQFGLSYLPLHVAVEQKLIEKHARAAGLGDVKITLSKLGSGGVGVRAGSQGSKAQEQGQQFHFDSPRYRLVGCALFHPTGGLRVAPPTLRNTIT